jgi:hypothetical protein
LAKLIKKIQVDTHFYHIIIPHWHSTGIKWPKAFQLDLAMSASRQGLSEIMTRRDKNTLFMGFYAPCAQNLTNFVVDFINDIE